MSKPRGSDYLDKMREGKEIVEKLDIKLDESQEQILKKIMDSNDKEKNIKENKLELQEIIKNNEKINDQSLLSKIENLFK